MSNNGHWVRKGYISRALQYWNPSPERMIGSFLILFGPIVFACNYLISFSYYTARTLLLFSRRHAYESVGRACNMHMHAYLYILISFPFYMQVNQLTLAWSRNMHVCNEYLIFSYFIPFYSLPFFFFFLISL